MSGPTSASDTATLSVLRAITTTAFRSTGLKPTTRPLSTAVGGRASARCSGADDSASTSDAWAVPFPAAEALTV